MNGRFQMYSPHANLGPTTAVSRPAGCPSTPGWFTVRRLMVHFVSIVWPFPVTEMVHCLRSPLQIGSLLRNGLMDTFVGLCPFYNRRKMVERAMRLTATVER